MQSPTTKNPRYIRMSTNKTALLFFTIYYYFLQSTLKSAIYVNSCVIQFWFFWFSRGKERQHVQRASYPLTLS